MEVGGQRKRGSVERTQMKQVEEESMNVDFWGREGILPSTVDCCRYSENRATLACCEYCRI